MMHLRCAGCGKPLQRGDHIVRIIKGTVVGEEDVRLGKTWGDLHLSCFARAVDSPELALAEIRAAADTGRSVAKQAG